MYQVLILCFGLPIMVYAVVLLGDLRRHRSELAQEPGRPLAIALATAFIQFLATFGVSDFNVSIPIYRAARWVDDRRLPGTLMTATVVPGAIISILYISGSLVELPTLVCCIAAQSIGSLVGGRLVSSLPAKVVRIAMAVLLLASTAVLLLKIVLGDASGGSLSGFPAATLLWLGPVYFCLGIINTLGFGVKAISMALLLTLGLSASYVLPVTLSGCCVGSCCGAIQFIRSDCYQRKITLVSSIAGTAGVVIGASLVQSMSTDVLQRIMVVVMLYTAVTMLRPVKKKAE